MLVNMDHTPSPEDQLRRLLSTLEFSPMRYKDQSKYEYVNNLSLIFRKEWSRKGRLNKNMSETYSHLFLALTKLIKVTKVGVKELKVKVQTHLSLNLDCAKMLPELSKSLQEDRTALQKWRLRNLFVKSTECKAFVGGTDNKPCEIDPTKV